MVERVETRGTRHPVRGAAIAAAIALPVVFGVAAPASAAPSVSHQGCTVTAQRPQKVGNLDTAKKATVRFTLKIRCTAGSEISFRHKIYEEDPPPGPAGDLLIHSHLLKHKFPGPNVSTFTHTDTFKLPNKDPDLTSEFYHTAYFRVNGQTPLSKTATSPTLTVLYR